MRGSSSHLPYGKKNTYKHKLGTAYTRDKADIQEGNTGMLSTAALFGKM